MVIKNNSLVLVQLSAPLKRLAALFPLPYAADILGVGDLTIDAVKLQQGRLHSHLKLGQRSNKNCCRAVIYSSTTISNR